MKLVCNYAPLRFLPYRETGEFVNVGVVVHCPQLDVFEFKTIPLLRTGRVSGFFPELDKNIFKRALKGMRAELTRVRGAHQLLPSTKVDPDRVRDGIRGFKELVRTREGILKFGDPGMILASNPKAVLEDLYGRYIERQFACRREYQETVMRNRLQEFLKKWDLFSFYEMNRQVGDEYFHVSMPFVHFDGRVPTKAIKPLDLNKREATEIFHHGGAWVNNLERLKNRNQLPEEVILTVSMPDGGKRQRAANEICSEFQALGVTAISFENTDLIRTAATVKRAA